MISVIVSLYIDELRIPNAIGICKAYGRNKNKRTHVGHCSRKQQRIIGAILYFPIMPEDN